MDMAQDLFERISGSPDYLCEPLDKFLKTYWTIGKRNDSDSSLASALATFGKNQSILKPASISRKRTIYVQPTSLARRVMSGTKGKHG